MHFMEDLNYSQIYVNDSRKRIINSVLLSTHSNDAAKSHIYFKFQAWIAYSLNISSAKNFSVFRELKTLNSGRLCHNLNNYNLICIQLTFALKKNDEGFDSEEERGKMHKTYAIKNVNFMILICSWGKFK